MLIIPPIFSTAYFPPIEYCSLITGYKSITLEIWENYHKQTWRNRTNILSANGVLSLIVPVKKIKAKTLISDMTIDYSTDWQRMHTNSIASAYGKSPYFIYYYSYINQIINNNHKYLLDLNNDILLFLKDEININLNINYSNEYIKNYNKDFRNYFSPKSTNNIKYEKYIQTFSDKYDFVEGLSIIDLIFNLGPDCKNYLEKMFNSFIKH